MTRLGFTSKGGSVEEQLERCADLSLGVRVFFESISRICHQFYEVSEPAPGQKIAMNIHEYPGILYSMT